jgi:hypothetical protein
MAALVNFKKSLRDVQAAAGLAGALSVAGIDGSLSGGVSIALRRMDCNYWGRGTGLALYGCGVRRIIHLGRKVILYFRAFSN